MSKISHFFRTRWKLVVNILTILALVAFVYAIRDQLADTWQNLHNVMWFFLLLIIPLQIWNYDAQTRLYRALFRIVGNKFTYRQMYETSLELNFVNNVFPSGGVSGISYFGARMRSENVTAGKATLVQLMKLMLLFLSFEILLVLGLFLVALEGNVNSLLLMITVVLSTLLVIGTALLAYVLGGKSRVSAFHTLLRLVVNSFMTVLTRRKRDFPLQKVKFLLDELHLNFKTIKSRYTDLKWPLVWATLANITEILTIYVVYAAFDQWVNPGAVILAYSVANFAGLVSVLPGGVGIYEAIMTTVLVAAGVPLAVGLPVTIMYRVLSTVTQLPFGYYFYHRTIHTGNIISSHNV
jgi:putative heme transporter